MNEELKKNGNASSKHKWRFFRLGGFDHVRLDTGADIVALDQLDQKLWATLSCPTHGLEFDNKTLELIDISKDGRIRVREMIAAVKWATSVLKNPDDLLKGSPELPLAAINANHPEGKQILFSAKQILADLGKEGVDFITTEDTLDTAKIFAKTKFNGDGVIPPNAASDDFTQSVIEDIIACCGSEKDRSGTPGISQVQANKFFAEAKLYSDWWQKAETDAANILPLGEGTANAGATFNSLKDKVDDYFTRCRLALFDSRATEHLNPKDAEYDALAVKSLSNAAQEIAALPLSKIEPGKPLALKEGINPAWVTGVAKLQAEVVMPLLGDKLTLQEGEWDLISNRFSAYQAWLSSKPVTVIEKLGLDRIRAILSQNSQEVIAALIANDKALETHVSSIASVDKLIRFHRDLHTLLNNFVSFKDFYTPGKNAIFQIGTLYLDGRSCELCVRVDDVAKHSAVAALSQTYIAYCDCTRKRNTEKMTIAAAFTAGDADNLMVGRNGVFYDLKNQAWDATIVKIIDNPISVSQAFWSPYKRLTRMIGEQIAKFAGAKEKAIQDQAATAIADTSKKVEAGKPKDAPPPFDVAKFAGIFAAIGLAIGAIGTAIASVLTGFMGLKIWQMPLALAGIFLAISVPSVILAWLKLRQRNLGPILDANGWAVNTLAKINIAFGSTLTDVARLPEGAERSLQDPFAEKKRPWKTYIAIIVILSILGGLWYKGYIQKWWEHYIPKSVQKTVEKTVEKIADSADSKVGDVVGVEGKASEVKAPEEKAPEGKAPESKATEGKATDSKQPASSKSESKGP